VTYLSGLIDDPSNPASPLPVVIKAVARPPAFSGLEAWPEPGVLTAVVGADLAAAVGVEIGEPHVIRLPPRPGSWTLPTLRVLPTATFRLSFPEFDERWLVVPLDELLRAFPDPGVAGVEADLEDPMAVEKVRARFERLEPDLYFNDWREMNQTLFAALRWQILSLFVVLSLVVAVASFQVSSALVVLAIDKRRSTGMLQALGAAPRRIRRVLVLAGSLLGGCGVVAGLAVGVVASVLASELRLIRFPSGLARVYMVDHIPLEVDPVHVVAVLAVCSLLVLLASLWPAWRTSRLDPVAALKAV
jgi:lipoprotein-releasing system permease protein